MLYKNLLSCYLFIADYKLLLTYFQLPLYSVAHVNFLLNEYDDDDDNDDDVLRMIGLHYHLYTCIV